MPGKKFNSFAKKIPTIQGEHQWRGNIQASQDAALRGREHAEIAKDQVSWEAMWDNLGLPVPGPLPKDAVALAIYAAPVEGRAEIELGQVARTVYETPEGKPFNGPHNPHLHVVYEKKSDKKVDDKTVSCPWIVKLFNGPVDAIVIREAWSDKPVLGAQSSTFFNKKTTFG